MTSHTSHTKISRIARMSATAFLFACAEAPQRVSDSAARYAADLAAIDSLHAADMRAVLAGDTATLMSLWTDDIVSLRPDKPIAVGRDQNAEQLRSGMVESANYEPVEYVLQFQPPELLGDHAVEWGTYRGKARAKANGAIIAHTGKVMRVLRRGPDGSWRVARTMFTQEASSGPTR